jgi:hypothetical protein
MITRAPKQDFKNEPGDPGFFGIILPIIVLCRTGMNQIGKIRITLFSK